MLALFACCLVCSLLLVHHNIMIGALRITGGTQQVLLDLF